MSIYDWSRFVHTDRQTNTQTHRHTDKQTDRQDNNTQFTQHNGCASNNDKIVSNIRAKALALGLYQNSPFGPSSRPNAVLPFTECYSKY